MLRLGARSRVQAGYRLAEVKAEAGGLGAARRVSAQFRGGLEGVSPVLVCPGRVAAAIQEAADEFDAVPLDALVSLTSADGERAAALRQGFVDAVERTSSPFW
jgi:hypothetical protein